MTHVEKPCACSTEPTIHSGAYSKDHGDIVWTCLGLDGETPCGRSKAPYSRARTLDPDILSGIADYTRRDVLEDKEVLEVSLGGQVLVRDTDAGWRLFDMRRDSPGVLSYRDASSFRIAVSRSMNRAKKWPRPVQSCGLIVWWTKEQAQAVADGLSDIIKLKGARRVADAVGIEPRTTL